MIFAGSICPYYLCPGVEFIFPALKILMLKLRKYYVAFIGETSKLLFFCFSPFFLNVPAASCCTRVHSATSSAAGQSAAYRSTNCVIPHSAIAASDIPTQKLKLLLTSTHTPTWVALSAFLQAYVRKGQLLLDRVRCDLGQSVTRMGRIRMPRKQAFICPHGKFH